MPFETDHDNDFQANNYVYADCNSSFRGMFAGLMLMIISIVFIILMFVGVQNEYEYIDLFNCIFFIH